MTTPLDQGGPIGNVRNFVSILREISFDEVREQAETIPNLLILAPTPAEARELGLQLTGGTGDLALTARELTSPPSNLDRFDAIVVFDPIGAGTAQIIRNEQMQLRGQSVVHVYNDAGISPDVALETVRQSIVRAVPDRAPAFGRAFPVFRAAAARQVINETSMTNAQFALIANVGSVVPIVGGLASAGADLIVLTKNQLMMMYKLGAMYGRDLYDQVAIIQELVPVVGAGFLWRTLARGATSFLPFAAGTIPKVGIAYAGTMAVGMSAEFYYRTNLRPTKEQLKGFQRQATEAFKRLRLPGLRRRGDQAQGETAGELAAGDRPTLLYLPTADAAREHGDDQAKESAT